MPAGSSGRPTSVPLTTSPARLPTAWPICAPNIELLIRAIIGSNWFIIAPRSGIPPPGIPGSWGSSPLSVSLSSWARMAPVMASLTAVATGPTRRPHIGIV